MVAFVLLRKTTATIISRKEIMVAFVLLRKTTATIISRKEIMVAVVLRSKTKIAQPLLLLFYYVKQKKHNHGFCIFSLSFLSEKIKKR